MGAPLQLAKFRIVVLSGVVTIVFIGATSLSSAELSESENNDSDDESEEDVVDKERFDVVDNSSLFLFTRF